MEVRVCPMSQLLEAGMLTVTVAGRELVVGRTLDGGCFAVRNLCPHHGAKLSGGVLSGTCRPTRQVGVYEFDDDLTVLRCPRHGFEFDVRSGLLVGEADSAWRVRVYPARIKEEWVEVSMPDVPRGGALNSDV